MVDLILLQHCTILMNKAILGLGTNLGDRAQNLVTALDHIRMQVGSIVRCSGVYETEPWGFESESSFLNLAISVETTLNPSGTLGRLLMIEALMGRLREGKGYSSRIIDIDILFFSDLIINEGDLIIPHPKLHLRRFVLKPLSDIEPGLIHPVFNKTINALLCDCQDNTIVNPYTMSVKLP